jgi:anion-transporting  ArsA/GET3 family ATPase
MSFLDTSILRFFLKPYFFAGRLTIKVATQTGAIALRLVDRFLGLDFLRDLSEFFLAFEAMYDGFKERASRVHALLRDEDSAFLLVASPAPAVLGEALYFHRRLEDKGMPLVGVIVNRVHADPMARPSREVRGKTVRVEAGLAAHLIRVVRDQQALARAEARSVARLEVDTGERPLLVPEFEADIHDLRDLKAVGDAIFGGLAAAGRSRRVSS